MTNGQKELALSFWEFVEFDKTGSNNGLKPVKANSIFLNLKGYILLQKIDNKVTLKETKNIGDSKENLIIVIFTKMKYLHDPKTYEKRVNEEIRRISKNRDDDLKAYTPAPIILICLEELEGVLQEKLNEKIGKNKNETEKEIDELKKQINVVRLLNLDPKVNFFDSSIWHRYVALNENFLENFKHVLNEIKENFILNLYKTNVAKEFLEFQTRLLRNSYLAKLSGGHHATKVEPFQFHSATEMELKADRIIKESFFESSGKSAFRWRLLFIDDFVENKLLVENEERGNGSGPSKTEIIKKVLNVPDDEDKYWLKIELCKSVDEFIKLYTGSNGKINDIILLDYLLGDKSTGNKTGREYSTDILKWIKCDLTVKENENELTLNEKLQGPLGKFWFFPISVFSYAFMEDIHQMGYRHLEDEWHIARGADPVNTPQLFRYSLFKFMEMQVKEARSFKTIDRLLKKVFLFSEKWDESRRIKEVRFLAKKNYHIFLKDMNAFELLLYDKIENSLFAKSFLEHYKKIDNALWGHLHHLIFMLGHEPASEWAKMWDEYNIVEDKLIAVNAYSKENDDYLKPIRDYIINLQKQVI